MATVSERAKELVERAFGKSPREEFTQLIEQALLAERRLARKEAFDEAARIALAGTITYSGRTELQLPAFTVRSNIAAELRAAAEKEVQK